MRNIYILIVVLIITAFSSRTIYGQWVHVSGLGGGSTKSLEVMGSNLFAGTQEGVYLSTDYGDTWTAVNNNLPITLIRYLYANNNRLYACGGGFYRTTDNGANWDDLGLYADVRGCVENDSGIFAGAWQDGVYRSTDDGSTWVEVNNGMTNPDASSMYVSESAVFAGGYLLYRSFDNGENWESLTNGLQDPPINVNSFTKIGSTLYLAAGGVYASTDNGDNWNCLGWSYIGVAAIYSYGTNLFAGVANDGVYLSTDGGANWASVTEGLPSEFYPQAFTICGDKIFLAAWFSGLYYRPLSELITAAEDVDNKIVTDYNLYQNFPNPFNPSTKIKYSVPQVSQVQIKVFDVLGSEMITLVNEEKPTGTYETTLDAVNLPSGIYFYQLRAGDFIQTKKMILLK